MKKIFLIIVLSFVSINIIYATNVLFISNFTSYGFNIGTDGGGGIVYASPLVPVSITSTGAYITRAKVDYNTSGCSAANDFGYYGPTTIVLTGCGITVTCTWYQATPTSDAYLSIFP